MKKTTKVVLATTMVLASGAASASVIPVPEPGSISLIGAGVLAVIIAKRFFKK
ncbi:PEP-CTERM sorting domain-containing protein [Alteromonas sp. ASW11-19]|uniref:PEP-CTERM sorting domain-containing protein n=1 Tax=Alteromonas salexigens TaxID=2982530 RepID=A0ABT2VJL8_9ALTE|nr:PEP-CTERM sorting domain-containing protein [Alteromonas salexigens]MCU7553200.1 PEP-CTERM sorting domain-containing protein [Alteromonas salexigens]